MADVKAPKSKIVVPPHDAKLVWLMASRTRRLPAEDEVVEEVLCYAGDPSSKTGFFPQLVRALRARAAALFPHFFLPF